MSTRPNAQSLSQTLNAHPLAHYFQLLLTRLMNNEEISEEAQHEMAAEAGINPVRIDEIAEFLNQWGNE
ncbi:protein [Escherichia coli]|nr:protein [Escherichia coli]